ncbi:MAG: succinate dehydrogenase assembly factor 2, partial [Rhodospirillales bacterium]|nr:succinate dehydrogenase assembly factor 2 [Rhodospirillales bacterium]
MSAPERDRREPEVGVLVRKLRFRCRALGIRELAVIMSGFFDAEGESMAVTELRVLARLLDTYADPDLMDFLLGTKAWPGWAATVSARIESHVRG